jgi:hypothetical protein
MLRIRSILTVVALALMFGAVAGCPWVPDGPDLTPFASEGG